MEMYEERFKEAYERLNGEQKQAVDAIEGPVMVVAGPGTGKTQILTLRIANILRKTDAKPEHILALTFTESGARAMRERLRSYIGPLAYRVSIHTFHGFAERLVREYPESYERIIGGHAASDLDKIGIIEQILSSNTWKHIRPLGDTSFYIKPILGAIATMKREGISPDRFSEIIAEQEKELSPIEKYHVKGAHKGKVRGEYQKKEKAVLKNKELLLVYRLYESSLRGQNLYDYEDMILETIRALGERSDLLRDLQETFQYILADEHQDVNGSQNRILELLASYHDRPNLFVVGDEKQAIYRFQGASLENFLFFEEVFPHTKTIALTANYRSGQKILNASHSLIATDSGPAKDLRIPLVAVTDEASRVGEYSFSHQSIESAWLVHEIVASIKEGTDPSQIAVIVRTNREVEELVRFLRANSITAVASAESDILVHPIASTMRALIGAVVSPEREDFLFKVLHLSSWGIPAEDLVRLLSARNYEHSLTQMIHDSVFLKKLKLAEPEKILRVGTVIDTARKKDGIVAPARIVQSLLTESGFLNEVLVNDALEGGRIIRRLYDEIERISIGNEEHTLAEIARTLDLLTLHNLPLQAPFIGVQRDAVNVMTAHKSKGLEFEEVYILNLTDSLWGGGRKVEYFSIPLTKHLNPDLFSGLDDERRLLYVAMTRAKRKVSLSYALQNNEGRELTPSRLLAEINPQHLRSESTANFETTFEPTDVFQNREETLRLNPELLKTIFLERGLSATALNNYLESPWQYLYRNVLRVPEVQSPAMQFGTALHGVMQQVMRLVQTKKSTPTPTTLKGMLERELQKLPISLEEFTQFHEKGLEALVAYIGTVGGRFPKISKEEFSIRVMMPTGDVDLPEIPLTGKLDRIDFDEEGKALRVVDYKTGKPKTRGQIEGKTKDSNGGYKRQLIFYALLLSLYEDERYRCREGILSFLEPDTKGVIHEESFTITDQEIADLKQEIIRVSKEITSGACLHAPCDPKVCAYCDLVSLITTEK